MLRTEEISEQRACTKTDAAPTFPVEKSTLHALQKEFRHAINSLNDPTPGQNHQKKQGNDEPHSF
jgi:hypothetical protein